MAANLALELAVTIRHDGAGGVTDDLADAAGLRQWLTRHQRSLTTGISAYDELLPLVTGLRQAVRSLFARAVRPGPPSPADAQRLLPDDLALARLNDAAARCPVTPQLHWPASKPATATTEPTPGDPADQVLAALARAAIELLGGPERELLRACPAPRCVRYFLKEHPRQEWCKPSCGNRARVARHYERSRQGR